MANVIIGIHGLGNKPPQTLLEHWWRSAMAEGLKTNNFQSILPKFELVYWADLVHDKPLSIFEKDENSPYYLDEKYVKASKNFVVESHSPRKRMVDFINKQLLHIFLNDDLSLNYSFITDAIIKKYFKDLEIYYSQDCTLENQDQCRINEQIKLRLIEVLKKYKNDNIFLIAHSMGSIIAFDVMSFVSPEIPIDTFVTIGSPLGLPVVISKIAAEQRQNHLESNFMITPQSITKNWYNFSDILDKVAFNYKLSDDFHPNNKGINPIDFIVTNNYEINNERNPHKSFGYLRTPEFATILNDFICSEKTSLMQRIAQYSAYFFQQIISRSTSIKKDLSKF